jgi:uncharacterized BrkB/YihY/UPF0761 family membrane protein
MSTDSPLPRRTEPGRALGSRRRLRLLAITLWTGFIGAALGVVTTIALLPAEATHAFGWAELSIGFFCAWGLAVVTITLALMLALPSVTERPGHGR